MFKGVSESQFVTMFDSLMVGSKFNIPGQSNICIQVIENILPYLLWYLN